MNPIGGKYRNNGLSAFLYADVSSCDAGLRTPIFFDKGCAETTFFSVFLRRKRW